MKTVISMLAVIVCGLVFQKSLTAQNDDQAYVIAEYMKVKPGMWNQYLECEKAWKHIHQERVKLGLITGWELEQVMFPGGAHTEYDFLTITHVKNWEAIGTLEDSWNDATWETLTKGMPADQKELANNANQYRDLVKREIWTAAAVVFPAGSNARPKYRVENFMKIPPGGWDDYMEMETRFVKPIHEKSMAMGNRAGWVLAVMVMPSGAELPYQVSTLDFYNAWEDMNKNNQEAWEAVYPDMSLGHINRRINATRTLVRSELRVLVDFVE